MTNGDFRRWRLRLDLTQAQAGERLGRSERQITAYERGEVIIPKAIQLAMKQLETEAASNA